MEDHISPAALFLRGIAIRESDGENKNIMLPGPILVANVIQTPSVFSSDTAVYQTATKTLRINGTGLKFARTMNIYFNPPLPRGVAHEITSVFPLTSDQDSATVSSGLTTWAH